MFMRVLERQHTIKFDMEKWKNLHAEAKMNLKDWTASLQREWANHFYEVIKQHIKYCVTIFSKYMVLKKGNILMTGYSMVNFRNVISKRKSFYKRMGK